MGTNFKKPISGARKSRSAGTLITESSSKEPEQYLVKAEIDSNNALIITNNKKVITKYSGGSGESPVEFLEITESQEISIDGSGVNVPLLTLDNITYIKKCFKNKKHIIILWYETAGSELHTHYLNVVSCNDFGNQLIIVKPSSTFDYEIKYSVSPITSEISVEGQSYAWQRDIKNLKKSLKSIDYLKFMNDDGDFQYITFYNDFADFGIKITTLIVDNNSIKSNLTLDNWMTDTLQTHTSNTLVEMFRITSPFITVNNITYSINLGLNKNFYFPILVVLENGSTIQCLGQSEVSMMYMSFKILWNESLNGITPTTIIVPIELYLTEN